MMVSRSRVHQLGWMVLLAVCLGLFLALSFRVHAVNSEVRLAEREIIKLRRETLMLETEFEVRANQRQLAEWNTVDFGYQAPRADQYLAGERQLAALGMPSLPGAPSPIRVARLTIEDPASPPQGEREMVSPLTGRPVEFTVARHQASNDFTGAFGDFLADASPVRTALAAEVAE